ncbi:glycosyltransferase [Alkalibaculum bacchi]|jgi:glycosyltransferase involved in cell wall biosynthesis|uniref:glycosyltransferase n=1 Tax=Alkalibaculum bacchi TaxID=645887 RepID=UPI0026E9793F|nr:glycosyltransferase [Alkalibaculum bacchi]
MYTADDHTFVICAYKDNPYLENTIKSIENQNDLGKVIVSTSTPSSFIEEICNKYNIPLLINHNPGLAGDDWNYGYNHAETSLVTVAHQDDLYDSNFLTSTLEILNSQPADDALFVFTDYYEIRNEQRVYSNRILKIKRWLNRPLLNSKLARCYIGKRESLRFGDAICCPSVTYVKSHLGLNIFDTKYTNSCDYATFVKLAQEPGAFLYLPKQIMGHRIYAESATSRNINQDIRRSEDFKILCSMWPEWLANIINLVYSMSEKSNEL